MKRFEYKVVSFPTKMAMNPKQFDDVAQQFETELNLLGSQGWELVQRQDAMFFFKREL